MHRTTPLFGSSRLGLGRLIAPALTLLVCLCAASVSADMRCNGRLVSDGDAKAKLLAHCGEPSTKGVIGVIKLLDDGQRILSKHVDEWSYPSKNTDGYQILRFEGGRLVGEGMRCGGRLVQAGDTVATVQSRCGAPLSKDAAGVMNVPAAPNELATATVGTETLVVQWIYERGEGQFMQIVTLQGGRILGIEDGPRQ